jgi:hypothetical protein
MRRNTLRKQITVLVPVDDWRVMRDEAARRGVAVTELCRATLEPLIDSLRSMGDGTQPVHGPDACDPDATPGPPRARNRPDHPWRRD